MPLAKEGLREMLLGTLVLGGLAALAGWLLWPLALAPLIVWVWMIAFFRDPRRVRSYEPGMLCSPADGTITEITEIAPGDAAGWRWGDAASEGGVQHAPYDGPAVRIGMFLSLFNVHINRMPCGGRVRDTRYTPGEFLDARSPDCGVRNEANTLLIDPDAPMPGPIIVRQVAGKVARRIICSLGRGDHATIGQRIGLIKFGSRTELIIPKLPGTEITVKVGQMVRGGLTILATQPLTTAGRASRDERSTATTAVPGGARAAV
jgi:phosphatidylserine decarboxylase